MGRNSTPCGIAALVPLPGGCSLFLLFQVAGRGSIPNVLTLRSHDAAALSDTANGTVGSEAGPSAEKIP